MGIVGKDCYGFIYVCVSEIALVILKLSFSITAVNTPHWFPLSELVGPISCLKLVAGTLIGRSHVV